MSYELGEGLHVNFISGKIDEIETNCSDCNEHIITKKNYEPLCPEYEEKKRRKEHIEL